ncbi:hypothetical protein EOS_35535 [Caballeronia mineralivorans PML1(12)]|uniref:EscG/YscG/SsaH family type III secretion system needle protein co-chaperone n=1 Tax=Caballeronia mineralivorans PML1(12) TaxID=908627 RepID=A0A0J1CLU3_9BURK|nr:EscG/YscG/SsaH family type III secretion system needle protein co-chaperone [Caballeronia mineralivorans]KLU21489.1 hypothetical protein EOS_35535 [Caballeronia mineralivorans PML1(12)]
MTQIDRASRCLLIQAAFAAVNHRLKPQIEAMIVILPSLIDDERDRELCRAVLLYGLERNIEALSHIGERQDPEARAVRVLITGGHAGDVAHVANP